MKKILFVILVVMITSAILMPTTIANIISRKDRWITVDKGNLDGVRIGMKGVVKAVYKDPSGEYDINIAIFEVKKIDQRSSEIYVESVGSGFKLEDSRYVVFEQTLIPLQKESEPQITEKKEEKSSEWYLEQGDAAAEVKNHKQAIKYYQKALELSPQSLIAKEKIKETQIKLQEEENIQKFQNRIQESSKQFDKKNLKYAVLYLIEAYQIYPQGKPEVQARMIIMAKDYSAEIKQILTEKEDEIKELKDVFLAMLDTEKKPADIEASTKKKVEPSRQTIKDETKVEVGKPYQNENGYQEAIFANDMTMVLIPESIFTLGSPEGKGDADEQPSHKVFIREFWLSKFEVTFAQYDRFCQATGKNLPSDEGWGRKDSPVINVSWEDATEYCKWLSRKTGMNFKLPTEAEWEKAAHDYYPWGKENPDGEKANFSDYQKWLKDNDSKADQEVDDGYAYTAPVGSYPKGSSKYGILDMAGNVWEWVADWYDPRYYEYSPNDSPAGPESGQEKVVRGGSWKDSSRIIRSANRSSEKPNNRLNVIGFRVALDSK